MRTKLAQLGLRTMFLLVSGLFLAVCLLVSPLLRRMVVARSGLSPGSMSADLFASLPFNPLQKVFVFNITNVDAFYAGEKPHFQQLGPYVFSLSLQKHMSWADGDSDLLTYRETRRFYFDAKQSQGFLNDTVYTVDPVYSVAQEVIDDLPVWVQNVIRPLLESRKILFEHTVGELLYDGYTDPLAELAHLFKPELPVIGGRIGFLRALNNTDDGDLTVYAGTTALTSDKRNVAVRWNNHSVIPFYEEGCNRIWGTNLELYPAHTDISEAPSELGMFMTMMCRPWNLHFNGTQTRHGLQLAAYSAHKDLFSATETAGEEQCHQPAGWPQGLFDISRCWQGFPALISLPHFLRADASLLRDVDGLRPDADLHDLGVDIYPLLGVPVHAALRVQVNVRIRRHLGTSLPNNPPIVYPILWQEIVLSESDESSLASAIFYAIEVPQRALVGLAGFLTGLAIIPFLCSCLAVIKERRSKTDEEEEAIVSSAEDISADDLSNTHEDHDRHRPQTVAV